MKPKIETTVRVPNEVARVISEAAAADGISVSAWVSRRLRNNLRRTGRLAPEHQPTTIEANQ